MSLKAALAGRHSFCDFYLSLPLTGDGAEGGQPHKMQLWTYVFAGIVAGEVYVCCVMYAVRVYVCVLCDVLCV